MKRGWKGHAVLLVCMLVGMILWSCEEVVSPKLLPSPPRLVIEGWVSDHQKDSYIKLSRTTDYNAPERPVPVAAERVFIQDDSGKIFQFQQQTAGLYLPEQINFAGEVGRTYFLEVLSEGQLYHASAFIPALSPVDSAKSHWFGGDAQRLPGYYISYYQQDPASLGNFYRWKVFKNGKIFEPNKIHLRNDDNVNGKYLEIELPHTFQLGDTINVQLSTLTERHFKYLSRLNALLEAGNPSEAVPENPVSNIQSDTEVLGFFGAGAVTTISIIIKE